MTVNFPRTQPEWQAALNALPSTPDKIPSFFFAHGSPSLVTTDAFDSKRSGIMKHLGPNGPLGLFLKDFGKTLLEKYKPKGILVFSAHWETLGERLVTDYGDSNPLLMDYYGFPQELYEIKFNSRGDAALSQQVVEQFKKAGMLARTVSTLEPRGRDGRGYNGPGLDHGVFVPFRIMFGNDFTEIPIVEASLDASMSPEGNWKIGQAVAALREQGILVLSGGLPVHNLRDFSSFSPDTAGPLHKAFDQAVLDAVDIKNETARQEALYNLTNHPGFRACNPREDHFVPLYIAAGAGEGGEVKILNAVYGVPTFAFGL